MTEITFTSNQDDYYDNNSTPVILYRDATGIDKLTDVSMSSPDFDGIVPMITASIGISQLKSGNYLGLLEDSNVNYYTVLRISAPDPLMDVPYTGEYSIFYLKGNSVFEEVVSSSTASVMAKYEDWNNKSVGNAGWTITPQGNAIFANIAARGRIEATSGYIGNTTSGWKIESNLLSNASVGFYAPSVITGQVAIFAGAPFDGRASAPFRVKYDGSMVSSNASITGNLTATTLDVGGANGIIYNGSAVTIGASVTINAPVTVNSLQVGASPTLLRIADNVSGTNDGIYINANNYWYSDGQFGVGGSANNVVWSGSSLTVTGTINATTITASNGTIAGFNLGKDNLTFGDITFSSSGGLRLGNPVKFSVDQNGNLVATSASITGNITANSGAFTGSISAQHITASTGSIAGFTLANNQMSTASVIVSSSGGLRLGNPTVFSVNQYGNLVATSASITGDITANSGRFTGSISAQHITASTGVVGGFNLSASSITDTGATASTVGITTGPIAFFAGANDQIGTNAKFYVTQTGSVYAQSASITGDITAQSGSFTGNVVISSGTLYAGSVTGTGQRVLINSTGLSGYTSTDSNAFYLSTGVSSRLSDGGFELQGGAGTSIGAPWSAFWGDASSIVVDTTVVKGGTKSMRIWDAASFLQSVNQTFTQTIGQVYSVTAWVRSSSTLNISNGYIEMWLLSSSVSTTPGYFDSNSTIQVVTPATSLTKDTWTKISGTYIATAPSATLALRTYSLSSSVSVYWDSIEVSVGTDVSNIGGFYFDDESLYTSYVNISSQGNATFGLFDSSATSNVASAVATTSNFLSISGVDPNYRLWVGSSDPKKAYLSIEKTGNININSGGDIILSSSALGASDSQLSKLSFRTDGTTTNHARLQWTPSASSFAVGTAGGSSLLRNFNLTAPSVNINGTDSINVTGQLNTQSTLMERSVSAISNPVLVLNSTNNYTSSWRAISFRKNGTDLGYITVSASVGSPRFESASDYRLKTNIQNVDLLTASEKIKALRPITFNWTSDPNSSVRTIGFLAHEVAEVIPDAVGGGNKDEVDEYGNIVPQTIMNTTFIEYIIASLKNALIRIESLEELIQSQSLEIEELYARISSSA